MTGAQAMVECLKAEGVKDIFGYPGVAICPFYDCLGESGIRHILVRAEQNAGHAANGYARVTGKPGVCVATSGPGATNLITALATANMDSIPLIAITGQVSSELLGKDVFQEADITGSAEPFTKYSYLIKDVNEIPKIFKEAFYIANTGRPGPVLIDVPCDIQKKLLNFSYPDTVNIRGYKPTIKGHVVQVKKVANAISESKKPVLCIGGGVVLSHAEKEIIKLSEEYDIPVVSTMMGIGAVPTEHPNYLGMIGSNGKLYANKAVGECDLLILVGARVADRAIVNPKLLEKRTSIIHIDIDPAEIGKNLETTIPLVGDVSHILNQLMEQNPSGDRKEWIDDIRRWKIELASIKEDREGYVNPATFLQELSKKLDDDVIYVADVGQNQMWSAGNHIVRKGRFLTSGGMGTMGYSVPAAMGAKAAFPNRQVVAVCGDGSFQMSLMELATMRQHNIPIKIVVFKNGYLGLVRQYQSDVYQSHFVGVDLDGSPNLEYIAKAYGFGFVRIKDMSEVKDGIDEFLKDNGPCLLECSVDPMESSKETR
ncbi:MAG: biosynthetic-type acetolactate synthase large subunit [Clostridiales bacterium]|nr:biosynthetic-type acetolactate synthase large subunit [Clostridiales bacterium]